MDLDWTEKYRPKSLAGALLDPSTVSDIKRWADSWKAGRPPKPGLILAGSAGVGKTTIALALARDRNWTLIELNASDARNYANLRKIAFAGAVNQTFSADGTFRDAASGGGQKLILLDEADNLYESSAAGGSGGNLGDTGGKRAIAEILAETRQPVVLTVNDLYELTKGRGSAIKTACKVVQVRPPDGQRLRRLLEAIVQKERVAIDPDGLQLIVDRARGDVRAAINDLQALALGAESRITLADATALGSRERATELRAALSVVLSRNSFAAAREATADIDEPPEDVLLWLDENLPYAYRDPAALSRAVDWLSRADVLLGRVRRRQQYGLWSYAREIMATGVAMAKDRPLQPPDQIRFPMRLIAMARSRGSREVRNSLGRKIRREFHCGRPESRDLQRDLRSMGHQSLPLAVAVARGLDLAEAETLELFGDDLGPRVAEAIETGVTPADVESPLATFGPPADGDDGDSGRRSGRPETDGPGRQPSLDEFGG